MEPRALHMLCKRVTNSAAAVYLMLSAEICGALARLEWPKSCKGDWEDLTAACHLQRQAIAGLQESAPGELPGFSSSLPTLCCSGLGGVQQLGAKGGAATEQNVITAGLGSV